MTWHFAFCINIVAMFMHVVYCILYCIRTIPEEIYCSICPYNPLISLKQATLWCQTRINSSPSFEVITAVLPWSHLSALCGFASYPLYV